SELDFVIVRSIFSDRRNWIEHGVASGQKEASRCGYQRKGLIHTLDSLWRYWIDCKSSCAGSISIGINRSTQTGHLRQIPRRSPVGSSGQSLRGSWVGSLGRSSREG